MDRNSWGYPNSKQGVGQHALRRRSRVQKLGSHSASQHANGLNGGSPLIMQTRPFPSLGQGIISLLRTEVSPQWIYIVYLVAILIFPVLL